MKCFTKRNKSFATKLFLLFTLIILATICNGMYIRNIEPSIESILVTGITPHIFEISVSDTNGFKDIDSVKVKVVFAEDNRSVDIDYTNFSGMGYYTDAIFVSGSEVKGVYKYEINATKGYEDKIYRVDVVANDKEFDVAGSRDFDFSRGGNLITGAAVFDVTFLKDGWNNIVQSIKRVFEWIKR